MAIKLPMPNFKSRFAIFAVAYIALNLVAFGAGAVRAKPDTVIADDCWRVVVKCTQLGSQKDSLQAYEGPEFELLNRTDYAHYVTYKIEYRGQLEESTDTLEFISQVAQTLADNRGWTRAGYVFSRVQQGAKADFTLALTQAEELDKIPGCSSQWSCRSGTLVLINEDRWNQATTSWNEAGGSLRDYRHMVVNHEVGHWLGLGHFTCSQGENGRAPIMQQQSIDLQGCKFNPWPLEFEISLLL